MQKSEKPEMGKAEAIKKVKFADRPQYQPVFDLPGKNENQEKDDLYLSDISL